MRALAEFIMRGRWQAAFAAAIGNLVPFASLAVVGLVGLRKGFVEGVLVLAWAALPLLITGFGNGATTLITVVSLCALAQMLVASEVLKSTASWQTVMLVSLVLSALVTLVLGRVFEPQLLQIQQNMNAFFAEAARQAQVEEVYSLSSTMLVGGIAYILLANVLCSLMIARWWQALLYNPGGFRAEMHQLRLGVYPAIVIVLVMLGCYGFSPDYLSWAAFAGTPLLVSGICFFHFLVAATGIGTFWLVVLYLGLVLFSPLGLVVVGLGFADSLLNLRARVPQKGN